MKNIELSDLILFDDFYKNETVRRAVSLFSNYGREDFVAIQKDMAAFIENATLGVNLWQNYVLNILAGCENPFSISAERQEDITESKVWQLARAELETVVAIFKLNFADLIAEVSGPHRKVAQIQNLAAFIPKVSNGDDKRNEIIDVLTSTNVDDGLSKLYTYYSKYGSGVLEGYNVFQWNNGLSGVSKSDPVSFDQLIGYEFEKNKLIENTEFLLANQKAANVLLYGDSGTGKSSSVKALINKFYDRGLKLISIDKNQILELPKILEFTAKRGCKFIIFIDDLTFENNDVEYKHFKSILEGNVKSHVDNTAIYVTSNRRNIIREVWSERENSDDVHLKDTLQEKKSLSDRFGLVITYGAPTKDEYLNIVKELAQKSGMECDSAMIGEALKWDVRRANRSGRTAKYFIDYYSSLMNKNRE